MKAEKNLRAMVVEQYQSLDTKSKLLLQLYEAINQFYGVNSEQTLADLVDLIDKALETDPAKDTPEISHLRGLVDFMKLDQS